MITNKPERDAGSDHIGRSGEIVSCTRCRTRGCDMCGGTGYRRVCHVPACYEHGCFFGSCFTEKPIGRNPSHDNQ